MHCQHIHPLCHPVDKSILGLESERQDVAMFLRWQQWQVYKQRRGRAVQLSCDECFYSSIEEVQLALLMKLNRV